MTLLALGLILWIAAHLFKRLAPGARAALDPAGRAVVAIAILAALVLMVIGYRQAEGTVFWGRSPMLTGLNNLLMLVSVYLFAAAGMKTALGRHLRHPMLMSVMVWSAAHLLVNGDTPSFLLFGGLGLWALVQIRVINASGPRPTPMPGKGAQMEIIAVAGTLAVYGAIAGAHYALGYPVFG
ncbi:MAG: NnrU family protein [Gemmobacter sp.]|jgi:uncharacterized membrane protein|nr:NnrU family protein [Gemmobacter sp.]